MERIFVKILVLQLFINWKKVENLNLFSPQTFDKFRELHWKGNMKYVSEKPSTSSVYVIAVYKSNKKYLDPFSINNRCIHVQYSLLDNTNRWKFRQHDINRLRTLHI